MPRAGQQAARAGWSGQKLAIFVLALVFFAQSYFVQSHVHVPSPITIAGTHGALTPAQVQPPDRSPQDNDPANCPLCQADMLSGAYLLPLVPVLLPLLAYVSAEIEHKTARWRLAETSHNWQGRAPPLS